MSTRAHLYRPVLDSAGNVRTNVSVRVLTPGTETPISETIYRFNDGSEAFSGQPLSFPNGVIDFYLDTPKRVRLGVVAGSLAEVFFDDVDVLLPAAPATSATGISFQPPSTMDAVTVQGALEEIEAHTEGLDTRLTDHIGSIGTVHDAAAISMTPNDVVTATTVEGALYELGAGLADHLNDDVDAHDASAISVVPAGDLTATDVQAALEELAAATAGAAAAPTFVVKTTDYTLTAADNIAFFHGATLTATLPSAAGIAGRQYVIKNLDPTVLTVVGSIDGDTSRTLAQYDAITVISDGTNWGVI